MICFPMFGSSAMRVKRHKFTLTLVYSISDLNNIHYYTHIQIFASEYRRKEPDGCTLLF
jgi:hypothetical protein